MFNIFVSIAECFTLHAYRRDNTCSAYVCLASAEASGSELVLFSLAALSSRYGRWNLATITRGFRACDLRSEYKDHGAPVLRAYSSLLLECVNQQNISMAFATASRRTSVQVFAKKTKAAPKARSYSVTNVSCRNALLLHVLACLG
jgi:hypothetical protein